MRSDWGHIHGKRNFSQSQDKFRVLNAPIPFLLLTKIHTRTDQKKNVKNKSTYKDGGREEREKEKVNGCLLVN